MGVQGEDFLLDIENYRPDPLDVDKWEISMSPDGYQTEFDSPLAMVQLASHMPNRSFSIDTAGGWMLLASSVHQIWVDQRVKGRFFKALQRRQTVQPGKHKYQASMGRVLVPVSVFVHCLRRAGCRTLRIKAYGQKLQMLDRYITREPAQVDHPQAKWNQWDIGRTFKTAYIWLWAPVQGNVPRAKTYAMVIPASGDFGSVRLDIKYGGHELSVKVYPRLVHVIKSFNSRLEGVVPKTVFGLRSRGKAAQEVINDLSMVDEEQMEGFRIEVTVQAASLADARTIVTATPFLDPRFWINPSSVDPQLEYLKLDAKLLNKKTLLSNANSVYTRAQVAGIFDGANTNKPSRRQIQGLTDVLASFGWNADVRKPTKSADKEAWWLDSEPDKVE
ncbi:hypothetical protein TREMEDRAFT_30502, partial [Tremella mesenterica DSM 1558]|uniref:uncharacterized protein n=1 Tax=Tremella mesenterica (strain ATCC 24925 / CBS 8224 / DSM 1558 / NBRC 9311 / NRRL Y-6157 / RJB 2259-6 / UBC 559-6) TaxID=578456 RepID=UPI0003F4919A